MPIKNYTTKVPANRSIEEIQSALVRHGALGMIFKYEQGTGRIEALNFVLPLNDQTFKFSLPVNWRRFQAVLKRDRVSRWDDEDYVYRVAWRNIRDWVLAQLALYETEIVDLGQVFLPFMTDRAGKTIYNLIQENPGQFLLGEGS